MARITAIIKYHDFKYRKGYVCSVVLQIPFQEVFRPQTPAQNTLSEGSNGALGPLGIIYIYIYVYIYILYMDNVSHMGVSKNRGTPKSSILIGFSIINHPFWGTPTFGNTHMDSVLKQIQKPHFKEKAPKRHRKHHVW